MLRDATMLARALLCTGQLSGEGLRVVAVAMKELPPTQTTYLRRRRKGLALVGYTMGLFLRTE